MKKILFVLTTLLSLSATAQIKMPAASPTQTLIQDFGLGKIEIVYSRPGLKGRAAFGNGTLLAPTGIVWRTGANGATKVTFSDPVTIGDKTLAAGSYGLFTIPGENEWTIIFNTNSKGWGSFEYKESEDVVRVKVKPEITSNNTETFTIGVGNITPETATISLKWAKTLVNVPIKTDIKSTIRKQVEASISAPTANGAAYQAAANFYFDMDKDYAKALANVNKAIEATPSAYWLFLLKAKAQKELGDKTGAKASAETCIKMATEGKNMDYVRSANDLIASL
ncbi:MAG: DUF2911 domain-containing protein [Chitinophagia bacterium]|jgi:hypothetical protein|nr:DUF2911 domain-containing protein [Chitinophagia bacterium]NCA29885.1 DUF2911 domain-containing protein [Chitinophagia bacterium]